MRLVLFILAFISISYAEICTQILADPVKFFSDNSNYIYIHKDTHCIDMARNLDSLRDASFKARGLNIDCDGYAAIEFKQKFQFKILKALLAPEIYKKSLLDQKTADRVINSNRDYFMVWSVKSLYNSLIYDEFNSFYQVAVPMLVDFYNLSYDKGSAIYYANRVANEYIKAAAGDYKVAESLSEFEKLIFDPNFDKNELISYLYINQVGTAELTNALEIAILNNKSIDFLSILIEWGANINSGHEGSIFYSLKNLAILKFLLSKGANVDYPNSFGKTPIFYAAEFKDENLVNLLIAKGANVNKTIISSVEKVAFDSAGSGYLPFSLCGLNHTSKTLLMHAAKYSNLAIVKTLIKNGARIDLVDDMGFSAIDFAKFNKDKSVYEYFKSLGLKERNSQGDIYE